MTGCGDSWAVMMAARDLMERLLGIPCEPMQALDLAYYFNRPLGHEPLVVALSSTGATTRTGAALMMAKARGARTLARSNTPGSALMTEAEFALLIHAERKGWPTQASTAAFGLIAALALELARRRGVAAATIDPFAEALDRVPEQIATVIGQSEPLARTIAGEEAERHMFLFAAAGSSFASAFFGAAKVKECTPDHALAIPLEEYHHYHSQKAGDPLFLTAPAGPSLHRARGTAEEGRRAGGSIYAIVTEGDEVLADVTDARWLLPTVPEPLAPLVYTVPLQLFAYHLAMAKFALAERSAA
jgi:glucosamine--fructose-6-phosphate aminotransferase (isomerizing)